jgi:hypothetical protein
MSVEAPKSISQKLEDIHKNAAKYFKAVLKKFPEGDGYFAPYDYWADLPERLKNEALGIASQLAGLAQQTGPAIRRSPLLTEADAREAGHAFKGMRAALRFEDFQHEDVEVLHDEGMVLGVQPARDYLTKVTPPEAAALFEKWISSLTSRLELSNPQPDEGSDIALTGPKAIAAGYRPGTAFIMMSMSHDEPALTDVSETIKDCFRKFGIDAVRSDDIEHEDIITQRIIDQIKTAEFLIADLTGERPSVYYEVGFAHALGRRVALFRKAGTPIHFDLAAYNCPEYENLSELRKLLMKRLESLTGAPPKNT